MSVKIISETLNSKGFVGIAELKENYVYLQPEGVEVSKIWVVRPKMGVPAKGRHATKHVRKPKFEISKNTTNRLLGRVSRSLKLSPNFKLYTKNNLIEYTKTLNQTAVGVRVMVDENFESDFYCSFRNHTRIRYISNKKIDILLEPDLVFKFLNIKSPYCEKNYSVLFRPSSYLIAEGDIWKLISILGEDFFEEQLNANHMVINETFIENSFRQSNQVYFISESNNKIFASLNERISFRNPDVKNIELYKLLDFLDIHNIEELIEKGEIKY